MCHVAHTNPGFTLNLENLENLEKSGKKILPGKVREKSGENEANLEKWNSCLDMKKLTKYAQIQLNIQKFSPAAGKIYSVYSLVGTYKHSYLSPHMNLRQP